MRAEGASLLDAVRQLVTKYVHLPGAEYADAMTLWAAHAHLIGELDTTPRLILKSPEKESGKTRALEVLELLVPRALMTMNATVPAIFRSLSEESATLLFDEVDTIFTSSKTGDMHEDLRGLLNAGYRRGAHVLRVVGEGKKMRVEHFPVFAATALAAIGDLPGTVESRAIIIPMRRRAPEEHVAPFRFKTATAEGAELRSWLEDWLGHHAAELGEPAMPDGIMDRAADIWEPLLAVADLAGEDWPERARHAAELIVQGRVAKDQSIGVQLLAAIRAVLDGPPAHDRMSSESLCGHLNRMEEARWGGWNDGRGIGQRDLANRLKVYGIESHNVRLEDGAQAKGYARADFADAWARYLREDAPAGERPKRPERPTNSVHGTAGTAGTDTYGSGANGSNGQHPSDGPHCPTCGGVLVRISSTRPRWCPTCAEVPDGTRVS